MLCGCASDDVVCCQNRERTIRLIRKMQVWVFCLLLSRQESNSRTKNGLVISKTKDGYSMQCKTVSDSMNCVIQFLSHAHLLFSYDAFDKFGQ